MVWATEGVGEVVEGRDVGVAMLVEAMHMDLGHHHRALTSCMWKAAMCVCRSSRHAILAIDMSEEGLPETADHMNQSASRNTFFAVSLIDGTRERHECMQWKMVESTDVRKYRY